MYGANAVKHILTRKAIARALHFIVESVLVSKLISDLIPLTSNDVEAENLIPSKAIVPATAISEDTAISKEEINEMQKLYNDVVEGIADEENVRSSKSVNIIVFWAHQLMTTAIVLGI